MLSLKTYNEDMQQDIEKFYEDCFNDLGWSYEPEGRHADIIHIQDVYMQNGCMWCLFEDEKIIGGVAVKTIDEKQKAAEMKRLYLAKEYQGRGYGGMLFEKAIDFCKENGFSKVYVDTRNDRDAAMHMIKKYGFRETKKYNDNHFSELYFELGL